MVTKPETGITIRSTQPITPAVARDDYDRLPFEFNSSIVIRPAQHVIPDLRGISREQLQSQLRQAAARPVTLLIGGSGTGKTSALARLCREQTHATPLWYTIEGPDVEPHTMLAHLFWALAAVAPALRERLRRDAVLFHSGQADWTDVLAHWLDALHDTPQPILLCIDGIGSLAPRLTPLFSQLIRRLHPRLRVVLSFAQQPDDALWTECMRLRGHDHLTIISEEALSFSTDEVRALCHHYDYAASEQDARTLWQLSAGWPYLLDLALYTRRGRPIAEVIALLAAVETSADLDALTVATLAEQLSAAELDQLICSSIASRLTDRTLSAACGPIDAAATLDRWYAALPTIHRIEPGIYVYHRLFRAALQRRFRELPAAHQVAVVRSSAAAAIAEGDWPAAVTQLVDQGDWEELCVALEPRAARLVLDRRLDGSLTEVLGRLAGSPALAASPWLLCYQAMEHRISRGDYVSTRRIGQMAIAQFIRRGDNDGHARALAEVAIAHYHLGQYSAALAELAVSPLPTQPTCAAALSFAIYLNQIGIGALDEAIQAAHQGLQVIEREPDVMRRTTWRIVIQRNLAVAYHFQGQLAAARAAAEDALQLARQYYMSDYTYVWGLYEIGLLEQRAGLLEQALGHLRRARDHVERSTSQKALWRWIVAAEGHALRDSGRLAEAAECYRIGGWGEGDEGPLMLWLLQGQHAEARCAAEARQVAAHASGSAFEAINITVFLALLDLERGATPAIQATLSEAAVHYAALGFAYHRAGVLFHLAAVAYELGQEAAGNQLLAEALGFGAERGYLNFVWWHPARMQSLLVRAIRAGIAREYCARLLRERGMAQPEAEPLAAPSPGARAPADQPLPATLALCCLGGFEVWVDGKALPRKHWQGHRAGAVRMQRMLLFLARHREPQPIDTIVRYVWPDIWNRIDVSTNFHLTLAGLRRVFEPGLDQGSASRFVLTTPQGYLLLASLHVTVDLDQFLTHVRSARLADAAGDQASARASFALAEQIYAGDFALSKPDPGEAEEYHRANLEAVRWLAHDDLRRGAFDACITRARRLLREDAWDTAAAALLIAAYLNRGNRRAARQQYERFVHLHGQPSPELIRLARAHWL